MTQRPTSVGTLFTCALLSIALTVSALAQSTEWKEYTSEKGKFSVMLPGNPTIGYRVSDPNSGIEEVYENGAKSWRVYYFDLPEIPSDAAAVKKMLNRRGDIPAVEPGSKKSMTMNRYPALQIKSPNFDGDKIWIMRIVLVKQRVYELCVVTRAKHAASEEVTKFFDSFKPVPMTDDEILTATRAAKERVDSRRLKVSGGVLQGSAVKKVQPAYPPEAKADRISGEVRVRVLISEEGNVIEAEAVEGPDLLRQLALAAAKQWIFKPTELAGMPVKLEGILIFKFARR